MADVRFDCWAIVELMGHLKLAGHVSEQNVAGAALLRVDVPPANGLAEFTRFFGAGSIYSLTPVSEEVARAVASTLNAAPISVYELPESIRQKLRTALPAPSPVEVDDFTSDEDPEGY